MIFTLNWGIFKNFRAVKILTGGLSGTHAEVRALNELLFELERKGEVITDVTLTEILGYNKQFLGKSKTQVMPRCADCFYLTELVRMISLN
ncbi:MAG: hypothetical protein H6578_01930 [Chitinophagales bacterium]|nr:hypothetical protein [Chitinophagales bacterium]